MATIFDRNKYVSQTGKNVNYILLNSDGIYQIVKKKIGEHGWYSVKAVVVYDFGSSDSPEEMQIILDEYAEDKGLSKYTGE